MQDSFIKTLILGVQMLFVAFGALVLVPLLTGFDPSIALFTAGAGTLLFQIITKRMVPVFLASSFAFIAPISFGVKEFGMGATLGGLACAGLAYIVFSIMVKTGGVEAIEKYLPAIVTGPVIMVIGLNLAPTAVNMAKSFDGSGNYNGQAMLIATVSLLTAILTVTYGKKIFSLIPILSGIVVGYVFSIILGVVNYDAITNAAWFSIPWVAAMKAGTYAVPVFDIAAILYIVPVAIAPAIEHVGDVLAISSATGKNYIKEPGLHRTLLGDGLATSLASVLGGPPNTTYSEVTGAVALTKAFNPMYMTIAAITAIILAFVGKLGAVLRTIPVPVMGGIMILLFGMIASIGVSTLVRDKVDFSKSRNLIIASVILVIGIGDLSFTMGKVTLGGIGLAGIIGIVLNLILPKEK
ncbi:uracil-xanthine permease [Denitrovibrio acetiphilus DSM 12809]|uniref:Uracil-xanthine permease n=1 Tax=Denitrovibrio acetiphilus (strain DSM 12809 / NBRC 114555 / N2460) TaxID=522772 RepID=D4H2D2_DENA2|nr:uracil-xanthine permease family protein [Denitrovibrio acetiphilus]ADD68923.1 uracil-xanthine permease [Denitrovibrio acetiphilus DSM 12809]